MSQNPALSKLEAKLMEIPTWQVSRELFGNTGADINDFELFNYAYFLDNAKSLEDLVRGLEELSPLADDALDIARTMTERDFCDFKLALVHERKQEESRMPEKFVRLLLPDNFMIGQPMAEKFEVPLGAAVIRLIEIEKDTS